MQFSTGEFLAKAIEVLVGFFSKGDKLELNVEIPIPVAAAPATEAILGVTQYNAKTYIDVDWTKEESQITNHFTVKEALTLHSWNRLGTLSDGVTEEVKENIYNLCQKLEKVRDLLNCNINVHCIFRSVEYNTEVLHSLPNDVHSMGMAIDFDCGSKLSIDQIKNILEPKLEELGLRMEKNTSTWVHLDTHSVGPSGRYFTA